MYGRLNQRKLREDDYILSCQKARAELDSYIDQEARRVNIDSAKKRAVLQHMDYEGFRQMVLGANIFPTKSLQLQKFSKGENSQIIQNKFYNNEGQQKNSEQVHRMKVSEQVLRKVEGKSQLQCNSFRQFKKKFNQQYPSNNQLDPIRGQKLYNLIKYQDEGRIGKIFNMQCEASILVKIVNVFEYIIGYLRESDNEGKVVKEVVYQIKLLETILKLKNMREFNLMVLSKKEKTKIIDFLLSTKQYILSKGNKTQNTTQKAQQQYQEQINQTNQLKEQVKDEDQKIIDELVQIISKK